jgi:L-alanine-DL-glutamate epimerase-like enolase superfamily enzyme
VTGETVESAVRFIERHDASIRTNVETLDDLIRWTDDHRVEIDADPAAFCAIEIALLDLLGRTQDQTIEALLGLPPLCGVFRYSAVLGDDLGALYCENLRRYLAAEFRDFKVKVTNDARHDCARLEPFRELTQAGLRLRLDANNAWRSVADCVAVLGRLSTPLFAVEEPLAPGDFVGCRAVARACDTRIVLDESLSTIDGLDRFDDPVPWIVNLRVSKLGGLLRTIALGARAKERGLGVIVGCHVGETGILARAGITVAHALGNEVIAMEGAFGTHLLRRDLVTPSPMFGWAGELDPAIVLEPSAPGLGLSVVTASLMPMSEPDPVRREDLDVAKEGARP